MKSAPLVRLENVSVSFGETRVLSNLTWALHRGEHWAVLGANGSGKSTFLRLVRGDVWPEPADVSRRIYTFDGREQTTSVGLRERIAFVSPELHERYLQQEWSLPVERVVASGFELGDYVQQSLSAAQRVRVDELLEQLGIPALRRRDVQQLSQGELRRVLIARALANAPRVLVLDEFCDGLDAVTRRSLLVELNRIARGGTQILYTTHRPGELLPCITHVLVLENGRIAWQGPEASHRARRAEMQLCETRVGAPASDPARFKAPPRATRRAGGWRSKANGSFLFHLRNASVFLERKPVLRALDWQMNADENWAVLGRNGAGKSTFLKLLAGEVHPALGGEVRRFSADSRLTLWQIRRRIGQVSSDFQAIYRDDVTGEQAIASGFFGSVGLLRRKPTTRHWRVVHSLVERFALGNFAQQNVQRMSYGQLRRILLARALVHAPAVLLLDEPFDGLDLASKHALQAALDDVSRNGTRLFVVTHHLEDLPRCITHAAVLDAGRVTHHGPLHDDATRCAVERLFGS
ncbi:MAG: ATP-binding cassette domain-containing protein [Verrucomicrobia bacterium]|nr:ATP-binding cassette domain-containing protein [Verrucomicrobiota bacterium]